MCGMVVYLHVHSPRTLEEIETIIDMVPSSCHASLILN